MKDVFVYEIVTAKGKDGIEVGLLTDNGLGNGLISARFEGEDLEIQSSKDAIRLKKVSTLVQDLIHGGSPFYIINLEQDSVEKVGVRH